MDKIKSVERAIENLKTYLGDIFWEIIDLDMQLILTEDNTVKSQIAELKEFESCINSILSRKYQELECDNNN